MQSLTTSVTNAGRPAQKNKGKKILFANFPGDGHFNPLTGLAKHLQSIGYDVRWYSSVGYAARLEKIGIPHFPFKIAKEVTGENFEEIFPERKAIKGKIKRLNFDLSNLFIARGPEYYQDIQEIYQSFPFDLMIADVAFTAIAFVKDKMNIPVISVGVFPLIETSKDLPPIGLGMMPSYSIAGRIKQSMLRFVADKFLFKQSNKAMETLLDENGISNDSNSNVFDLLVKKSTLLLQSGTPGFEYYRSDLGSNIRFVGALLPYNSGKQTEQWFDGRLNKYEKIVLVTQGTVEKDVEKILVPTLEAFKDTNILVVATTGGSQTKELKARYPQQNFIIEDFIPFDDVMPYADVYVTNGGYGGVMLGIENKLPLVVAGVHEGKNEINARIGYFELGINLNTESPKPAQLMAAVDKVTGDQKYRRNIIKLGEEFAQYDPNRLCEKYVAEIISAAGKNKEASLLAVMK